jgi:hypothetical protein
MKMPSTLLRRSIILVSIITSVSLGWQACKPRSDKSDLTQRDFQGKGSFPIWSYDGGPNPKTDLGNELINIHANLPYFPGLSHAIFGDQMFRPAFGPVIWRMIQEPNSVKILFIGQDATHIAEAAGRTATAGFGGRAQDLAKYFGVGSSAAFINTFPYTIRWQYSFFDTPIISSSGDGQKLSYGSFTSNPVWLLSQDVDSPIVKWRNQLISWIIKNNKKSLKMIVLFGGAARDTMGSFVTANGGTVGSRYSESDLVKLKIPEFQAVYSGGNTQAFSPLTAEGRDLYREFAGQQPKYEDEESMNQLRSKFQQEFNSASARWTQKMVFSGGGVGGSGVLHPAQLGGYDVNRKMSINGKTTISLKGMKLADGTSIDGDLLVTQLPHPTALSSMSDSDASAAVKNGIKPLEPYTRAGWKIEPDSGLTSNFAQGRDYRYDRASMGTEYYDFGAPNSRMVNVSSASRMSTNVIVFGTRDKVRFDQEAIKAMGEATPSVTPPSNEVWITKPNGTDGTKNPGPKNRRYTFDPGPPEEFAKIMKTTLPTDSNFIRKRDDNGDYAHYRGTFKAPRVLIVADPDGYDDLVTARALTGARGQYLQTLMDGLGVGEKYLVIKTAPYGQDPDWQETFNATKPYRETLLKKIIESSKPELILTDGKFAKEEAARILNLTGVPIVNIERNGLGNSSGIAQVLSQIKKVKGFAKASFSDKMSDIPRSHMTYYARAWEGTSGDRVIASPDPQYAGKAYAFVAPRWAYKQNFVMQSSDVAGCERLFKKSLKAKIRLGGEPVAKMSDRLRSGAVPANPCQSQKSSPSPAPDVDSPTDESNETREERL